MPWVRLVIVREYDTPYNAERGLDAIIPKIEKVDWTVDDWTITKE